MVKNKAAREGYIKVKGGKIWYSISAEDKATIPLLLLHGGPGASHYYLEPLRALSVQRPVILYDQLGCGRSERPKDNTLWIIERFIDEIEMLREELKLNKVHILGHSWGTMLAVDYMLTRKPQGVASLILSSPCLSVSRWQDDCRRFISELDPFDRRVIEESEASRNFDSEQYRQAMLNFYKKHLCRIYPWPECVEKTFENMGTDVYGYMWGPSEFSVMGTLKNYERADKLKDIKLSVLFTCGRYDESSPETTEYFHKMVRGSEFKIFEDAAHMHHIEKTELYLDTASAFLKRVENQGMEGVA